jgi:hypothetical protein
MSELAEQRRELVGVVETLVRDRHEHPGRTQGSDQRGERGGRLPLRVEGAVTLPAVDPLASDAVALGRIPADERFPDVIVGKERVLVVRRVEIDEVDVEGRREGRGVEARDHPCRALHRLGQPQLEVVERPRRPGLQIGHLEPRRRIDPISRLDERGQEHTALERRELVILDRVADRVDPRAVSRLQEARLATERLGEIPFAARKCRELREDRGEPRPVQLLVGSDISVPEGLGVRRDVVRVHFESQRAQRLPDPRRAREEIACGLHRQPRRYAADQRDEHAFRAEVLDHSAVLTVA